MKTKNKRFHWLQKQIEENHYTIGAQVGTGKGPLTAHIMKSNHGKKFTLIDVAYYPMNGDENTTKRAQELWEKRVAPYRHKVKIIELPSIEAAKQIDDESLDFVFIDADHSFESVLADITAWFPKVRKGGLISGHDFEHPRFPGVSKAVCKYFEENFAYSISNDYVWWSIK